MYSLDIFICNYYLLFVRHSVLYIRFGEINSLYLVSCLRRWPDIDTALRDCPVFADCRIAMRVTLTYPDARKTTSQTNDTLAQCWCIDGTPCATLGQHYLNQNLLRSNHIYNREYFFLTLFKNATL